MSTMSESEWHRSLMTSKREWERDLGVVGDYTGEIDQSWTMLASGTVATPPEVPEQWQGRV